MENHVFVFEEDWDFSEQVGVLQDEILSDGQTKKTSRCMS